MLKLNPSLKVLRVLAGEGNFHLYRQLRDGRRLFLFVKLLLTTWAYFRGQAAAIDVRNLVFVKGANQLRYYGYVKNKIDHEFGVLQVFGVNQISTREVGLLPSMSWSSVICQIWFLVMFMMSGKQRHLNLYLLSFFFGMNEIAEKGLINIQTFVCFNDQPYDVAALVFALSQRESVRTIVIQHGLILSEEFYFPTVAKEFWAWGELSKQHFRARAKGSQILIKGRYIFDKIDKSAEFLRIPDDHFVRVLVAPSFFHHEVKTLLADLKKASPGGHGVRIKIAIKFHPATKLLTLLRAWCKKHFPEIEEEIESMEALSGKYDVLVTKDSTSAVDFIIKGKPVFFQDMPDTGYFPSRDYGFELADISNINKCYEWSCARKNEARISFVKMTLDV